jgi:hypothetical protein
MANSVFFAWQLDTPSENNKKFIWDALQRAAENAAVPGKPEVSPRPESDTQGMPGSPNIVDAIFKRIRACAVFVADLTFVGTTTGGKKKVPNPNVLIELGFAARSIGWDRTILVLNDAYGAADCLPFDILQHRWPIVYRVTEKTEVRERRFETLTAALEAALRDCEQHTLTRASEMMAALDTACFAYIARNEATAHIGVPLPPRTRGDQLTGIDTNLVVRRLIELGALSVVTEPGLFYTWTYDGRRMIAQINKAFPTLLPLLRRG